MKKIVASFIVFSLFLFNFSSITMAQSKYYISTPKQEYTYEKMTRDIQQLAKDYPELVEYKSLGKTAYGRDIWAVKVGKGDSTLLVTGSHHAREWISTILTMHMAYKYAAAYQSKQSIKGYHVKDVLDHTTIWFIPMVNPDGVTLQQKGLSAFPKEVHNQLIKMNNGSKDFKRWKANAQGIDPNRNYDTDWNKIQNSPANPFWKNHKGSKPGQIAEVQAVMKLVGEVNPQMLLDYHSSGEVLYWDYKRDYKNRQRDRVISTKIASMTGYQLMFSQNRAIGASADWFIEKFGKPALTPELGKYAGETNVPISAFDRIWKQHEAVPLYAATESYQLWLDKQKLVHLSDVRVDLLKNTTLYSKPLQSANLTLAPQRVSVVGEKADWYLIKTDKGNMWIKKENTKEYTVQGFVDYKEGEYWSEPILWSVEKGLISGSVINDRRYLKPMDNLTEAQFLAILFRYAKPDELSTTVPQSKHWASVPYQLAAEYQLPVEGSLGNMEKANKPITRSKMAQILASFHFGDPYISLEEAVQFMYEANISNGYDASNKTFENFGVNDILKRAHISTFFMKYDSFLQNEALHDTSNNNTEDSSGE
ncbi:M14 family zinc carboxypeptidase [Sporosarcina sp. 179-K 3D1 HS]|uniref:M14 family zinc carboxypeptidase n=1 Tax=Sporosarcina sp. 179-K 3D1 HS TaxID=3232169 RepID=UPI0039A0397B